MQEATQDNLVKEPESTYFVHFQDCDPFGHLNNARYFDYFLNAREEHTHRYYNLNLMELAREHQANWVVTNHQIAYLRPADHSKIISIQTRLIYSDNNTLVVEGIMMNKEKTKFKSLLWTTMRFISFKTGKTTDHPQTIMDLLTQLRVGEVVYDPGNFQNRIKQINQQVKSQG